MKNMYLEIYSDIRFLRIMWKGRKLPFSHNSQKPEYGKAQRFYLIIRNRKWNLEKDYFQMSLIYWLYHLTQPLNLEFCENPEHGNSNNSRWCKLQIYFYLGVNKSWGEAAIPRWSTKRCWAYLERFQRRI